MRSACELAVIGGLALFALAGYQTVAYRDGLNLTQEHFEEVPLVVIAEVVFAFALCLWGSLGLAGDFKPISPFAYQQGLDAHSFRPDFMAFNHRGHLLPLDLAPLAS